MPFATSIVPMPRWSTPVGCTKLVLTVVILAFVATCATIWGCYPAFSISLVTASFSLVTFGYYMLALSFKPSLYNKYLILTLEAFLTISWFVSLILLAGWTGANSGIPRHYYELTPYPVSIKAPGVTEREGMEIGRTMVRHHGQHARYAAQILAGIAAGLAGLVFILYGTTTATFAMNFHQTTTDTETTTLTSTANDEEAQTQTQTAPQTVPRPETSSSTTVPPSQHSHRHNSMIGTHPSPLQSNSTHTQTITAVPISPTTTMENPSMTERIDVDVLPHDFEPAQERNTYHETMEEPIYGVMGVTPVNEEEVDEKRKSTTVKEDGRVEREI